MAHYQTLPRDEHELTSSPGPAQSNTLNSPYDPIDENTGIARDGNSPPGLAQSDPLNDSQTTFNPYNLYKDFNNDENINLVSARPRRVFFFHFNIYFFALRAKAYAQAYTQQSILSTTMIHLLFRPNFLPRRFLPKLKG